jgi:hypothetical protein
VGRSASLDGLPARFIDDPKCGTFNPDPLALRAPASDLGPAADVGLLPRTPARDADVELPAEHRVDSGGRPAGHPVASPWDRNGGALAGEGRGQLFEPDAARVVLEDPADHGGLRLVDPPLDVALHTDVDVAVDHTASDVPGLRLSGQGVVGPSPGHRARGLTGEAGETGQHLGGGACP